MLPIKRQQKKTQCLEQYKTLLGKDYEVEMIMKLLKEINIQKNTKNTSTMSNC